MTDRDHFAAAALTGLVGACGYNSPEDVAGEAYALADAMIRERGTPVSDNCVAGNQPEIGCPTNHDAAPIANCDMADAMLRERTSNNNASLIVSSRDTADGVASPSGSGSGGPINRSAPERQSPASDCGGGEPLDDCVQTMGSAPGGRGHNTPVGCTLTAEERAALHWFGHYGLPEHRAATLRSLLERMS